MSIRSKIIKSIFDGDNIAVISPGGTGKSHLVKVIASTIPSLVISVTSTTGVGAVQVGGTTLHSWAGIGKGQGSAESLVTFIEKHKADAKARWLTTQLLIIDEVSMLGAGLFNKLNKVAQLIRNNTQIFGGIKLFLTGDFCQLPPVNDAYVFTSSIWDNLNLKFFILTVPRRFTDEEYARRLLRIRKGNQNSADVAMIRKKFRDFDQSTIEKMTIRPTILHSKKVDVAEHNSRMISSISSPSKVYTSIDTISIMNDKADPDRYTKIFNDTIPETLTFKVGAQVMLTANVDITSGLINGSRGIVVNMMDDGITVMFKTCTRKITIFTWTIEEPKVAYASRSQIPLILAWALSIHKIQGSTLDSAVIDLGPSVFAPFQAYVALSRVRTLDGLYVSNFIPRSLKIDRNTVDFVNDMEKIGTKESVDDPGTSEDEGKCVAIILDDMKAKFCGQCCPLENDYCSEHEQLNQKHFFLLDEKNICQTIEYAERTCNDGNVMGAKWVRKLLKCCVVKMQKNYLVFVD
jgi:ATP-dependent DNA helicase PIF1